MADGEGMSRPGPPLSRLVGPAEEDDRQGAGGGRQVSWAGIRADEEVGPLQLKGKAQTVRTFRVTGKK